LGIILYVSSLAASQAEIAVYSIGLAVTIATIIITVLVFIYNYAVKSDVIAVGISKKNKS
jgi:hypothetical protein